MKQVVQSISGGAVRIVEVPRPAIGPTEVLVRTIATILSPGTERAVTALAQSSLLAKARARPDLVKQVVRRARAEGIGPTMRAVRTRLDEDMPLGYAGVGVAVEVGEAVEGVRPGQRVATGSAGHAEFQVVPGQLAVPVPEGVSDEAAAFATIGAIALHGLRLAELGPGARVCVIGLGLVGQLAVRLGLAAGYQVAGIDLREWTVERAHDAGAFALVEAGDATTRAVIEWSRGRGVDAVLLTAATKSSEPARRATELCRDRAGVVVVGDVGLELDRRPLYEKELTLRVARSYGPGRYDRSYEEWGVDYPIGHVRWTEGRNLEAVLDLLSTRRLTVDDLVTHTFPIERAPEAYELLEGGKEPYLGVQLAYMADASDDRVIEIAPRRKGGLSIGLIGAGAFAKGTLVPALKTAGFDRFAVVASASGVSARHLAERHGFERAASSPEAVIESDDVDVIVIATPHNTHAELTIRALDAGKHVFCEKPLALSFDELDAVEAAWKRNPGHLMVGFNRRWSDSVRRVKEHFGEAGGPLVLTYRVNAGPVPPGHWYEDRRQGGRLLGEVCHFIDTCNAIVGVPVADVSAYGTAAREASLPGDLVVAMRYEDGSGAAITYSTGGFAGTAKERLEVLGRGRGVVVDDYNLVTVNGRRARGIARGKGHGNQFARLREGIVDGYRLPTDEMLLSMSTTLVAGDRLADRASSFRDEGLSGDV